MCPRICQPRSLRFVPSPCILCRTVSRADCPLRVSLGKLWVVKRWVLIQYSQLRFRAWPPSSFSNRCRWTTNQICEFPFKKSRVWVQDQNEGALAFNVGSLERDSFILEDLSASELTYMEQRNPETDVSWPFTYTVQHMLAKGMLLSKGTCRESFRVVYFMIAFWSNYRQYSRM